MTTKMRIRRRPSVKDLRAKFEIQSDSIEQDMDPKLENVETNDRRSRSVEPNKRNKNLSRSSSRDKMNNAEARLAVLPTPAYVIHKGEVVTPKKQRPGKTQRSLSNTSGCPVCTCNESTSCEDSPTGDTTNDDLIQKDHATEVDDLSSITGSTTSEEATYGTREVINPVEVVEQDGVSEVSTTDDEQNIETKEDKVAMWKERLQQISAQIDEGNAISEEEETECECGEGEYCDACEANENQEVVQEEEANQSEGESSSEESDAQIEEEQVVEEEEPIVEDQENVSEVDENEAVVDEEESQKDRGLVESKQNARVIKRKKSKKSKCSWKRVLCTLISTIILVVVITVPLVFLGAANSGAIKYTALEKIGVADPLVKAGIVKKPTVVQKVYDAVGTIVHSVTDDKK